MTAVAEKPAPEKRRGLGDITQRGASTFKIDPRKIVVEKDFNTRNLDLNDPVQRAALDELKASIEVFGLLQPMGTRYDPGAASAILVFGHRRLIAILELVDEGKIEPLVSVLSITAKDEARRKAINIAENIHVALNDVELGEGFQALIDRGMTVEKIAEVMRSYPLAKIRACLALADSPIAVKQMVSAGEATPALARKVTREHGDAAPAVLKTKVAEAKAAGKSTATRTKTVALPKPPKADAIGEAAQALFEIACGRMSEDSDDVRLPKSEFFALGKALFGEKDARVRALAPA
jgi:ParB-like chromosome segregation protein Spo0J